MRLHGSKDIQSVTLIWLGFIGFRFEVGGGGGESKITPYIKHIKIMLET